MNTLKDKAVWYVLQFLLSGWVIFQVTKIGSIIKINASD